MISAIVEKPIYSCKHRGPRKSTADALEVIKFCLEENEKKRQTGRSKQQMRRTDIHGYLIKQGFDISYSTVKRLVNQLEESRHEEAFIHQEYDPGKVCEFDWGEVKLNIGGTGYHKYQMAAFATAYGNYRFAVLFRSQDTVAFQEAHVRFFKFCKGVYPMVVYDNMKVAVRNFVGPTEKEPTDALLQLSAYYRFQFRFCNARRGNEKPHVERTVDVMRHFAFCEPGSDVFDSLESANACLLDKCRKKNREKLSDGRIPEKTFLEEKPLLLTELPEMPCFITKPGCRVDKYSTISVNHVRYSVPDIYVKKKVDVRIYTDRIEVYKDSQKIARHTRSYQQGSYHLNIFHYLRTLKTKPGALSQSTALLQSDTLIKTIYEKYYSNDPRTFLEVLDVIHELGADTVYNSIQTLLRISPGDLSADKIKAVSGDFKIEYNTITSQEYSPLGKRISDGLSQYDRLMSAMNRRREAAT